MLSTLCSDPLCPVAVMHPVMRSAMLPCNLQTLFLANQRQGSIDSCSRLDRRRVTLRPVAVHLVKRDAMLSHLQPALHRASISVQASCSAVDCGVQCSRLFLHSRCNACKRSRQSVGLIELCATMRAKQFNRCPGRLVLSSPEKRKRRHRTRQSAANCANSLHSFCDARRAHFTREHCTSSWLYVLHMCQY